MVSEARDSALVLWLIGYLLAGRPLLRLSGAAREPLFALLNLTVAAGLFYGPLAPARGFGLLYLLLVVASWALLQRVGPARRGTLASRAWVPAFFLPLLALVAVKYLPWLWRPLWAWLGTTAEQREASLYFVGLSYMAFRLSAVVVEVRGGLVAAPRLARYLSFAFFFPTLLLGPIGAYSQFARSLERGAAGPGEPLSGQALLRIIVGFTKYLFLANLCNQLAYAGLVLDRHPHPRLDWLISAVSYYLYLYCNFSGFCDVAVGAAGVLGLRLAENFDRPFAARNIKDYWNRWHITLSQYMRDVLFTPLCKALIKRLGVGAREHVIAAAIFVVFTVTGVWHGFGLNYLIFGVLHGAAVVAHHYYTGALRRRLSAEQLRRYNESRLVQAVAVSATFLYVSACLAIFANNKGLERTLEFLHRKP